MRLPFALARYALLVLVAALPGCGRQTQFNIPEGWVVSPQNDRAKAEAGYRIQHEQFGLELVYVPAGTFMMGSEGGYPDARPVHEVQLSAYWIGRTEITAGQWLDVRGKLPRPGGGARNDQGDHHPVVYVDWRGCGAIWGGLGLRLPTEAEWEYAARGPEGRAFPWGDEWDQKKCCNANNKGPGGKTFPAGSFPQGASWCGALDMAGNVAEWCSDRYADDYYAASGLIDPRGPRGWGHKVVRGGGLVPDKP